MKEEDFPDKVKELIEENKESEFQLTYQDGIYMDLTFFLDHPAYIRLDIQQI